MDFRLTEDQERFRDMTRDLARREFLPQAAAWDREPGAYPDRAVAQLGEWCTIDLVDGAGQVPRLVAVAHGDPMMEAAVWDLARRYPAVPADVQVTAKLFVDSDPSNVRSLTYTGKASPAGLFGAAQGMKAFPLDAPGEYHAQVLATHTDADGHLWVSVMRHAGVVFSTTSPVIARGKKYSVGGKYVERGETHFEGWVEANGSMTQVAHTWQQHYAPPPDGSRRSHPWFGHPARLTIEGVDAPYSRIIEEPATIGSGSRRLRRWAGGCASAAAAPIRCCGRCNTRTRRRSSSPRRG